MPYPFHHQLLYHNQFSYPLASRTRLSAFVRPVVLKTILVSYNSLLGFVVLIVRTTEISVSFARITAHLFGPFKKWLTLYLKHYLVNGLVKDGVNSFESFWIFLIILLIILPVLSSPLHSISFSLEVGPVSSPIIILNSRKLIYFSQEIIKKFWGTLCKIVIDAIDIPWQTKLESANGKLQFTIFGLLEQLPVSMGILS